MSRLPEGYRWAGANETERHSNVKPIKGAQWITSPGADADSPNADLAVPVGTLSCEPQVISSRLTRLGFTRSRKHTTRVRGYHVRSEGFRVESAGRLGGSYITYHYKSAVSRENRIAQLRDIAGALQDEGYTVRHDGEWSVTVDSADNR